MRSLPNNENCQSSVSRNNSSSGRTRTNVSKVGGMVLPDVVLLCIVSTSADPLWRSDGFPSPLSHQGSKVAVRPIKRANILTAKMASFFRISVERRRFYLLSSIRRLNRGRLPTTPIAGSLGAYHLQVIASTSTRR